MKQIQPLRTGTVNANGIEIYFETFGDPQNETIILIMGNGYDHTIWHTRFYEPLVDAGYQVLCFDNRDVGRSTWISDWHKDRPYSLEDMAKDTVELLDALRINKAHVVGLSMGGQIAQRLAISHGERVLTLTLFSTTGFIFDQDPAVHPEIYAEFGNEVAAIASQFPDLQANGHDSIEFNVRVWKSIAGSRFQFDEGYYRNLFARMMEAGSYNQNAAFHHTSVARVSGSRLSELDQITVPTLVFHGKEDPVVHYAHSEKLASLIPGARLLLLEGVGHEIPNELAVQIHADMFEIFALVTKEKA